MNSWAFLKKLQFFFYNSKFTITIKYILICIVAQNFKNFHDIVMVLIDFSYSSSPIFIFLGQATYTAVLSTGWCIRKYCRRKYYIKNRQMSSSIRTQYFHKTVCQNCDSDKWDNNITLNNKRSHQVHHLKRNDVISFE